MVFLECERDGIVPTLYTIVVNYALATNSTVPLGHKLVGEVHIERIYHHNLEVYKNLSITQLKLNILK